MGFKVIAREQDLVEVFRFSGELRILKVLCRNCGTLNLIPCMPVRDEHVECEKSSYKEKTEKGVTPGKFRDEEVPMPFAGNLVWKLPPEFSDWFAKQPHSSVIKLTEVVEAYKKFEREKK